MLDREEVAIRAYRRWEAAGWPEGQAEAHWLAAEQELRATPPETENATRRSATPGRDAAAESATSESPPITNLDRALPPSARRKTRRSRQAAETAATGGGDVSASNRERAPTTHFVVTLNRAHLRIYRAETGGAANEGALKLEQAVDLPEGKASYTARDTDQAGRFGSPLGGPAGASIDERLPMQEEHDRRLADELAAQVEAFLRQHPQATWDFAAGPAMHHTVLEHLSPAARDRLGVAIPKDLVHQPPEKWRAHFSNRER
jgi:hypothetical protein